MAQWPPLNTPLCKVQKLKLSQNRLPEDSPRGSGEPTVTNLPTSAVIQRTFMTKITEIFVQLTMYGESSMWRIFHATNFL